MAANREIDHAVAQKNTRGTKTLIHHPKALVK
jgi:hypothetical protein